MASLLARRLHARSSSAHLRLSKWRWYSQARTPLTQSWVKGGQDPPLIKDTFGKLFERQAFTHGDQDFMVMALNNVHLSWKETLYRADSLATGLLRLGFTKGDRIGIWMPNYEEWTLLQIASARIGVILVNFNPRHGPSPSYPRWLLACPNSRSSLPA